MFVEHLGILRKDFGLKIHGMSKAQQVLHAWPVVRGLCVDTATSTDRIRCWAVRFLDDGTRCCCNSSGLCSIRCIAEPNVKKGYVVFSSLP